MNLHFVKVQHLINNLQITNNKLITYNNTQQEDNLITIYSSNNSENYIINIFKLHLHLITYLEFHF